MTYSYSGPLTYAPPQQNGFYYNDMAYQKSSAMPATATGMVIGGLAGGGISAYLSKRKNSCLKNGEVSDSFAKDVFEKYINKSKDVTKDAYIGGKNILKELDSVKTPEELKKIFEANKEAAQEVCTELKQKPEEFLNKVTENNLKENKKTIKEKIVAGNNTRYQDMKNQIQLCWNKDKKKFIKNEKVSDDVFKIIKKSTDNIKTKSVMIGAAIGASVLGVLGFIGHKLTTK